MPGKKASVTALPSRPLDPHNINSRLQNQVATLLTQLEEGEHVTLRERVQALVAIGRIQIMFVGLRKEKADEPERGSAVRKYAAAFEANDARRRKTGTGPAPGSLEAVRAEDDEIAALAGLNDDDDGDDAA
jgi:hypothetical protein